MGSIVNCKGLVKLQLWFHRWKAFFLVGIYCRNWVIGTLVYVQLEMGAVGSSQQVAPPAGRAAAPSDSSQRVDALTPPDMPAGWTPPSPSPPVHVEYLSEEGPSTPEVFSSSSSWESEPINSGGHYRRVATGPDAAPHGPHRHTRCLAHVLPEPDPFTGQGTRR